MNLVNPYIFTPPITYNTYIGGVSASISTASALATKLGISVGAISNFTIVGSDIKCRITGSYAMPNTAFYFDTNITYYQDSDNLVTSLGNSSFSGTTKIKTVEFHGVTSIGTEIIRESEVERVILPFCTTTTNSSFFSTYKLDILYLGRVTSLGTTSGDNGVFVSSYCKKLYVPVALQTSNSGSPDGDITYLINRGTSISYVPNFTAPSNVTNLSLNIAYNNACEFNFTAPSSANTIDFYEGYVDGNYIGTLKEKAVFDLAQNTSYSNFSIKVVDIYYNKSSLSNLISFTTTNVADTYYTTTDIQALAYLSASGVTGTDAVASTHYEIFQLKNKGLWWKTKAVYLFKGTTSTMQKWNARNPLDTNAAFRLGISGSGTYSDLGWQLNGTNAYADTFINASTDLLYAKNGITLVIGTNVAKDDAIEVGMFPSSGQSYYMNVRRYNANYDRTLANSTAGITQTGVNDAKGIWMGIRQNYNTTKFFRNNSQIGSTNTNLALQFANLKLFIGALNYNGSPYAYSGQRVQTLIIDSGFTDSEKTNLYNIIDYAENMAGRKTW